MSDHHNTVPHPKAFGIRTMILLVLIASSALAVCVADDFVWRVGPQPWPPQYRYLSRIPFAREVFGPWP